MREVHDRVQAFVGAIQVPLVAPELQAFTGDALEESGKGRKHLHLLSPAAHGQAIGDQGGNLLLDTQLETVPGRDMLHGFIQLGRWIEVTRDVEELLRESLGDRFVSELGTGAGTGFRSRLGQAGCVQLFRAQHQVWRPGCRACLGNDHA